VIPATVRLPSGATTTVEPLEENGVTVTYPIDVVGFTIALCLKALVMFPFKRRHSYNLSRPPSADAVHPSAREGVGRGSVVNGAETLFQGGRLSFLVALACGCGAASPLSPCRSMPPSSAQPAAGVKRKSVWKQVACQKSGLRGSILGCARTHVILYRYRLSN